MLELMEFIFDGDTPNIHECFRMVKENFANDTYREKPSLQEGMQEFLDTL